MTQSQDQELEYVPIDEESILPELVIRLVAISDPEVLDSLLAQSVQSLCEG